MLKEIIHVCYTGLGDCVVGYVSSYLFQKILEKYDLCHPILTIDWRSVKCPFLKKEYLHHSHASRHSTTMINCLYAGTDGTLGFKNYYQSHRMLHEIRTKKHMKLVINQYIGRCLIDPRVSREEISSLTVEAYRHFWCQVVDHSKIPILDHYPKNYQEISAVYVRLGDQYLCDHQTSFIPELKTLYQSLTSLQNQQDLHQVMLLGDLDNQVMNTVLSQQNPHVEIYPLKTHPKHSATDLHESDWIQIFNDLYAMLKSKRLIILSNHSNFFRIILFLRDPHQSEVYLLKNHVLEKVSDLSTVFAKHYDF